MPDSKSVVQSKTFWANVLMACVAPFVPVQYHAYIPQVIAVVNVALRLISHGKVELK